MKDALRNAFPALSADQLERLLQDDGLACPLCSAWVQLDAMIAAGGPVCGGCETRVEMPGPGHSTQLAPAPSPQDLGQPIGQPADATLPAPLIPGDGSLPERIGRYLLQEPVGRGGMGVVWRGYDPELQREVAVKILHAGGDHVDRERFRREARIAASLDHPAIVRTLDVGTEGQELYIVQEFVKGISLAQRLEHWRPTPDEAVSLLLPLAEGMAYAREAGVIHRDLKPGNVMIHEDTGDARITDFGLARRLNEDSDLSVTGQIIGTPRYLAPEMLEQGVTLTHAADIYGLGAIFYELLTAQPPIAGESLEQILFKVSLGEIIPPRTLRPELPPPIEAICLKCLARDPAERYATADLLAEDLRCVLDDRPISILPPPLPVTGLAGSTLGSVQLIRELEQTAHGVFYQGTRSETGPVLVQVLPPLRDFRGQQRKLGPVLDLSHPNILEISAIEETEQGYTLLISAEQQLLSLAQILREQGPLEQALAVAIQRQLLAGLSYLHQQSLCHGQLTTACVMLSRPGQPDQYVKLIESGLCADDRPNPPTATDDLNAALVIFHQLLAGGEAGDPTLPLSQARPDYPFDPRLQPLLETPRQSAAASAKALPDLRGPSPLHHALRLTPIWLLLLYICLGPLIVQRPDGTRIVQLSPTAQRLNPGDRVVARGLIQWALSGLYPLPPIGHTPTLEPPAEPDLERYADYCRERGVATQARAGRQAPGMAWIPASSGQAEFWIDRRLVTQGAFGLFIDDLQRQFPDRTYRTPAGWKSPTTSAQGLLPVVGLSWYDAQLFASWSGKSLPTDAQWAAAGPAIKRLRSSGTDWEWLRDIPAGAPRHRMIRGGVLGASPRTQRTDALPAALRRLDVGFRCVQRGRG